jgi:hypothetical protein
MARPCARPDCAQPARSTFSYRYAERTVWLVDLADEAHPSTYDLCVRHASSLNVPVGWELRDGRGRLPQLALEAS